MLGDKIAKLRKEKNISQEELADIFNTSRQAISKWERGESYPDIDRLKDLAIYFSVSVDYLLDYDIESSSVDSFTKKLNDSIQNNDLTTTTEEIKTMVSKYPNSFELLVGAVDYLSECYYEKKDESALDLALDYTKRCLLVYKSNNSLGVTLSDIHHGIVDIYYLKREYALAKNYIKEHDVMDVDAELSECEYHLGNKEESSKIVYTYYLRSVMKLIESSILQIVKLQMDGKYTEAYEMTEWTISFIKTIEKNGNLFLRLIYVLTFIKASIEKTLKVSYKESLTFLKENYLKAESSKDDTDSIKFSQYKKTRIRTVYKGIKEEILESLDYFEKDSLNYESGLFVYKELFKE